MFLGGPGLRNQRFDTTPRQYKRYEDHQKRKGFQRTKDETHGCKILLHKGSVEDRKYRATTLSHEYYDCRFFYQTTTR
jgi:hypothetical protein